MHMIAGSPSTITSPQTPFQQQFSGYPFPNTLGSVPAQMNASSFSGTPTTAPLPQQSHFAQSFGQYPQPPLGYAQDPNLMHAQLHSQVVQQQQQQQQYSPQLPFGATAAFVAQQQQQQPVSPNNAAYGGWQNMHGNFQ
jgi:stromal membrane-associated protein